MIIKNNIPKLKRNNSSTVSIKSGAYSSGFVINNEAGVIDSLGSNSNTEALSARLGKILNESKLSKNGEDTAKEKITFKKGLVTDGDIKSSEYSAEKGLGLFKDYNGNWNLEIDNIKARKSLNVQELNIDEAKYIGGALYCTLASMKVSKIEPLANSYRLYFKKENSDGLSLSNLFQLGDMALCQTFHNNLVRRWWRGVTRTGSDFIEVSLKACEVGSDYPQIGDEVILFGSVKNRDRLGAVVIEPLCIKVYDHISTFTVPEPLIRLSPSSTKIDADQINFLGQTIINGKFMVADNGDVTMNNATVSGDLKVRTFRMFANQKDSKGRLTSSFINMPDDYILPLLEPDEVRSLKVFMGRPSRTTTAPVHFTAENSTVKIDVQEKSNFVVDLTNFDIYDSIWLAYGFGGVSETVWLFYLEKQFV